MLSFLIMSDSSSDAFGCGCLILLAFIVGGGFVAYKAADDAGWVQHTKTVDMYMKGDWIVGEDRECDGYQNPDPGNGGFSMSSLFCPTGYFTQQGHNISVTFWGKVSRPEAWKNQIILHWQCTRTSDSFTCKALD